MRLSKALGIGVDEPSAAVEHDQRVVEPAAREYRAANEQIDLEPGRDGRDGAEGLAECGGLERAEITSVTSDGALRKQYRGRADLGSLGGGILDFLEIIWTAATRRRF